MKLGVRSKLFLLSLGMVALALLAADLYLTAALDRHLTERIRQDLLVRAALVADEVSSAARPVDDVPSWDALADVLGHKARARVTLIRRDGVVLGDSRVEPQQLAGVENHLHRPEVFNALGGGAGADVRESHTVGQRMMYVAVPIRRDGAVVGVARVALPLQEVDDATAELGAVLLGGTAVALLLGVLLSALAAHRWSRSVRELTAAAEQMAAGRLAEPIPRLGDDEIATLGHALEHLAANLSTTLTALRGERDLLQGILRGMAEGILVLGADRRVVLVNPALRAMVLLDADVVGRPLLDVIRSAPLAELLERALSGEQPSAEIVLGELRPRRLLVQATPVPGTPGALLAVFLDVTDMRRLEQMRKDFVANASHELRTPISAVRSAAETLHSALHKPDVAARFLDIIQRNATRLEQLTEDLLELSRLESGGLHLEMEAVDLRAVVQALVAQFQPRAAAKPVRLRVEIPEGLPALHADRRGVEQALGNLVDNAIKYCPAGSSVCVRAAVQGAQVRVDVADDGPGMEPRHLPRLFERFYRVDTGRSREVGGTGLGLSIVKHLTEAMGGSVEVHSTPGAGSTFSLILAQSPPAA